MLWSFFLFLMLWSFSGQSLMLLLQILGSSGLSRNREKLCDSWTGHFACLGDRCSLKNAEGPEKTPPNLSPGLGPRHH